MHNLEWEGQTETTSGSSCLRHPLSFFFFFSLHARGMSCILCGQSHVFPTIHQCVFFHLCKRRGEKNPRLYIYIYIALGSFS